MVVCSWNSGRSLATAAALLKLLGDMLRLDVLASVSFGGTSLVAVDASISFEDVFASDNLLLAQGEAIRRCGLRIFVLDARARIRIVIIFCL